MSPALPTSDSADAVNRNELLAIFPLTNTTPKMQRIQDVVPLDRYKGTWAAGVFAVGDYTLFSGTFYVCKSPRTAANTDDPSVDTGSWDAVGGGVALASEPERTATASYSSSGVDSVGEIRKYAGEWQFYPSGNWNKDVRKGAHFEAQQSDTIYERGTISNVYTSGSALHFTLSDVTKAGTFADGTDNTTVRTEGQYVEWGDLPDDLPAWVSGTSYVVGKPVRHNGGLYVCRVANSDTTFTPSHWYDALVQVTGGDAIGVTLNGHTITVAVEDGGIETDKLADDAVTADKIAAGVIPDGASESSVAQAEAGTDDSAANATRMSPRRVKSAIAAQVLKELAGNDTDLFGDEVAANVYLPSNSGARQGSFGFTTDTSGAPVQANGVRLENLSDGNYTFFWSTTLRTNSDLNVWALDAAKGVSDYPSGKVLYIHSQYPFDKSKYIQLTLTAAATAAGSGAQAYLYAPVTVDVVGGNIDNDQDWYRVTLEQPSDLDLDIPVDAISGLTQRIDDQFQPLSTDRWYEVGSYASYSGTTDQRGQIYFFTGATPSAANTIYDKSAAADYSGVVKIALGKKGFPQADPADNFHIDLPAPGVGTVLYIHADIPYNKDKFLEFTVSAVTSAGSGNQALYILTGTTEQTGGNFFVGPANFMRVTADEPNDLTVPGNQVEIDNNFLNRMRQLPNFAAAHASSLASWLIASPRPSGWSSFMDSLVEAIEALTGTVLARLRKIIQGNNETETIRLTRVTGTPAAAGQISLDNLTNSGGGQILMWPPATTKDGTPFSVNDLKEFKANDFSTYGDVEWEIGDTPWGIFQNSVLQANLVPADGYTFDANDLPALNATDDFVLEGRDIHLGLVIRSILKRSSPNIGGKGGTQKQVWTRGSGDENADWGDAAEPMGVVSDTAPSTPANGSLWLDTTTQTLKRYATKPHIDDELYTDLTGISASPHGFCADGEHAWVIDRAVDKAFHFLVSGFGPLVREDSRDFDLDSLNGAAVGACTDGTRIWVGDNGQHKAFAYSFADGSRLASYDITFDSANRNATALGTDESVVWVADNSDGKAYAHTIAANMPRNNAKDISYSGGLDNPHGMALDGDELYIIDATDDKAYAYSLNNSVATAVGDDDFDLATGATPVSADYDDGVIYVADNGTTKHVRAYRAKGWVTLTEDIGNALGLLQGKVLNAKAPHGIRRSNVTALEWTGSTTEYSSVMTITLNSVPANTQIRVRGAIACARFDQGQNMLIAMIRRKFGAGSYGALIGSGDYNKVTQKQYAIDNAWIDGVIEIVEFDFIFDGPSTSQNVKINFSIAAVDQGNSLLLRAETLYLNRVRQTWGNAWPGTDGSYISWMEATYEKAGGSITAQTTTTRDTA